MQRAVGITSAPGQGSVVSNVDFASLELSASTQKAIAEMGFEKMMEIQAKSIPPLLQGRDVLGAAKTGRFSLQAVALQLSSILLLCDCDCTARKTGRGGSPHTFPSHSNCTQAKYSVPSVILSAALHGLELRLSHLTMLPIRP